MTKWTLCLATILCLGIAAYNSNARELTLDDIFPADRVIDVQITVTQRDWDTIRYQGRDFMTALGASRQFKPMERPYTYVEASVSIDGVVFPKVGLRKKGFIGSLSHTRPSLKIKLNHVDKKGGIEGLTNLTLNNNKQDTSLMSQFMGYALFNAIGSPAPRCAYAKVTVNGESLGIYSHVETVRKPLLKRAFGNSKGVLYEGTVVDFYEDWENSFEHKRGNDERGRAQIKALIDVLADPKATEADIGALVDLGSFYRFWATEGLVGFWDGYSGNKNNFFAYLNPEDNKFYFIPWGMDSIFTKMSKLEFMNDRRAPISVKTQGLIAYKLYQFETGRQRYAEALTKILDNHWNVPELLATLDKMAVMVEPHLAPAQQTIEEEWDGNRGGWGKSNKPTFASELDKVRDFIRNRASDVQAEIANGMPVWRRPPDPPFAIPEDGDFSKGFQKLIENTLAGAARDGDLEAIKQHIAEGADVNALHFDMPPLTWTAMMGQTEAAELLLRHGANINGRNKDENTALHLAVFLGRAEITEFLLKNGADINARNDDGATAIDILGVPWEMTQFLTKPMGIALEQEQFEDGRAKIREMFGTAPKLGVKTVPNVQDSNSKDLWAAARTGNLQAIKRHIEEGGDINALDNGFRLSAIAWGTLHGQTEVVQFLIENGVDVNLKNGDGTTPLHSAAFLGRVDVAKLLLENGADVKARNNDGATPVDVLSVDWETTAFVCSLIGIDIEEAEIAVMKKGRNEIAKLFGVDGVLGEAGAFSAQRLSEAAFTGNIAAMKQMLVDGADPNTKDPQSGSTLLATAALMGHTKIVALLLEHGADVNVRSRDGGTALHAAAFLGRAETVKLLLEKGADATLKNGMGSTAIDGAKLDWAFTKGIIGMLRIEVDEAKVKAGRTEVIKLISQ